MVFGSHVCQLERLHKHPIIILRGLTCHPVYKVLSTFLESVQEFDAAVPIFTTVGA